MVGGDQRHAAFLSDSVRHTAHAGVNGFHSRDRRVEHAGVADHVAVGEVQNDHVILLGMDCFHQLVRYFIGAHFRLHVVSGNLRALHQDAVLTVILLFHAAVEEERHMGVFLRLGNAELFEALLGDVLAEGVHQRLRLEGHLHVRHRGVILRHADVSKREEAVFALEAGEVRVDKGAGDLAGAVGTEVEEDHRVVRLDLAASGAHNRHDKLVGHVVGVGVGHGLHRVAALHALAVYHRGIRLFDAIPAVVTVHGVVAAHDRRDLSDADLAELFAAGGDEVLAGAGRHVTAVEQGMDVNLLQAVTLGQLHKAVKMGDVAVHAAVGEQADQVQSGVVFLRVFHGGEERLVLKEGAVLDRLRDAGQLLIHDAARADVRVADFTVAHLAVRQAHVHTGRADLGQRVRGKQAVKVRFLGRGDRVPLRRGNAEAVEDHKQKRFLSHGNQSSCLIRRRGRPSNAGLDAPSCTFV